MRSPEEIRANIADNEKSWHFHMGWFSGLITGALIVLIASNVGATLGAGA